MAQTYVYGTFASSDMVGIPESVARGMAELNNSTHALLTAISPNLDNLVEPCRDVTHYYFEKQWRPLRTTLNGACAAGAAAITFHHQSFKPGELVAVDEEIIELGTTADYLTFDITTRSVGSGADATHADGASAVGLGKAWLQGSAAADADMIVEPNKVTQYTHIFKRSCGVSGTAAVLDEYHRNGVSRYDANVVEQQENLLQELENAVIRSVAQAAAAGTAGRMDSIYERLAASGSTTSLSGAAPTRDNIRTVLRSVKDYSGGAFYPDWLFVSDYVKDVIDDWQLPRVQIDPASPFAQTYGADVARLNLGGTILNVKALSKLKTHMIMLTSQFARVGPLRGPAGSREFSHKFLGVDGDRVKGEIVGEYTNQVPAPLAHHIWYNVASS
jgi:hypothetical protein